MIDFSKIKITEKKLGTFGDIQLQGQILFESSKNLINGIPPIIFDSEREFARSEIRRELHDKIYGELKSPFFYLEDIIKSYVIPNMGYSQHPYFVNEKELLENLEKIRKILEFPR